MTNTQLIFGVAIILLLIIIIIVASNIIKKAKRNSIYKEEKKIEESNATLYNNLVDELERTKKISKNEESIKLYNLWIEDFERINLKKESLDNLYLELDNFYNDKDHKNFISTFNELEGKRYKFDEDLKTLYKKVKQYTEYELDNTRISLNLKTKIKDLNYLFEQKLEMLEIFNNTFYSEIESSKLLIAEFEQLQRDGDYPEGRNILKKCNRTIKKIEYTLDIILKLYDYIIELEEDIQLMKSVANEIETIGFSINIRDFEDKVVLYTENKEVIFEQIIGISFKDELDNEFVDTLQDELKELNNDINELKDIVEEKFNFIKEILTIIDENDELIAFADEVLKAAAIEKHEIITLYEIEDAKQIKRIDSDIETYHKFKEDYEKLLEISHSAKEDYATIKTRIKQSNTYLLHLINNMKLSLIELKSVRDDENKAIDNLILYNTTLVQIDLYLRRYDHRDNISAEVNTLLEEASSKIITLQEELNNKPLNINSVRSLDSIVHKLLSSLINYKLEQDIRRRIGAKELIKYCSIFNSSDELNLTIKRMYSEYNRNEYLKVLKDSNELLTTMTDNGTKIYKNIVERVDHYKFGDIFTRTVEKYTLGEE